MPVKYGKWSVEDVEYLKTNYPAIGLSEMSKKLNRSVKSTDYKIRQIGIPRRFKAERDAEKKINLKNNQLRLRSGSNIGNWTLLEKVNNGRYRSGWNCKCSRCGDESVVSILSFERGDGSTCKRCLRLGKGEAGLNRLMEAYINNSALRGQQFSLTKNEFHILTSGTCHYCGIEPYRHVHRKIKNSWGDYVYNGIDRLDNKTGYILHNCVTCCWPCNSMRGRMPYKEFCELIQRIANYHLTHKWSPRSMDEMAGNNGKDNKSRS